MNRLLLAAAFALGVSSLGYAAQPAVPSLNSAVLNNNAPILAACHHWHNGHCVDYKYQDDYDDHPHHHHHYDDNDEYYDPPPHYSDNFYHQYPHHDNCVILGAPPLTFESCH